MKAMLLLVIFAVAFGVAKAAVISSTDAPAGTDEINQEQEPPMGFGNIPQEWQQPESEGLRKEPRTFSNLFPQLFPQLLPNLFG